MEDTNGDDQDTEEVDIAEEDQVDEDTSDNEDKQSIQDDAELDEETDEDIEEDKLYESDDDVSDKINVFDNSKTTYNKYDHELEDLGDNVNYKLSDNFRNNHVLKYHNECLYKNFNEIKELCNITRNKDGIIVDNLHKTIPILTKYEKTKILGMRVKQLNNGALPYISSSEKMIDNYLIAKLELDEKKLPFIIQRPLPNNNFEYWKLRDLDIL
jgi:DNA-directed RNA polymerase subunit K/omega